MRSIRGARLAFLDLDGSLLRGNSFHFWCLHLSRTRPGASRGIASAYALRALRALPSDRFREAGLRPFRGGPRSELDGAADAFVRDVLSSRFRHRGLHFVRGLQGEGIRCVLLTGSLEPIASACARRLGIADVRASAIEVTDGMVTGRLLGPEVRGLGKREFVEGLASEGVNLADCVGVGDDREDLPFLSLLGRRILVNWRGALPDGAWEPVEW